MLHFFTSHNKKDKVQHLSMKATITMPSDDKSLDHIAEFQVDDQPETEWVIEVNKTSTRPDSKAIHGRVQDTQFPNPQTPFFFVGQVDSDGIADLHLYRDL